MIFKQRNFLIIVFFCAIFATRTYAEEYTARYFDAKSNQERSILTYKADDILLAEKPVIYVTQQGRGAFDRFNDVQWMIKSQIETERFLPLQTVGRIQSAKDETLYESTFELNLAEDLINVIIHDKGKVSQFTLPLKEPFCDYADLNLFLQQRMARWDFASVEHFYLLTISGKMYKVNMKFVTKENLKIGDKKIPAVKVRLIADMGILDDVFDRFVPPTFVWFAADPPHHWLKYQGMETTADSAYVGIERQINP